MQIYKRLGPTGGHFSQCTKLLCKEMRDTGPNEKLQCHYHKLRLTPLSCYQELWFFLQPQFARLSVSYLLKTHLSSKCWTPGTDVNLGYITTLVETAAAAKNFILLHVTHNLFNRRWLSSTVCHPCVKAIKATFDSSK